MNKKLLFIFGTRPEAIKMLPIINCARRQYAEQFVIKVCVTGQHRQMLDQVLQIFEVIPDYDLLIMVDGQDLYDITAKVLLKLRTVFTDFSPDCVLVHGDTTTTLAASLAAYYQKIPVAHVEAGLRTHNIYSPWPEEINRQVTARIARYHFAPTDSNKANLRQEAITDHVVVVGNSVIDALLWVVAKINNDLTLRVQLMRQFTALGLDFTRPLVLITGHRRENFGQGFINICQAIKELALLHPQVQLLYPVHLNPNVRVPVHEILNNIANVYLLEPQDYLPFVFLMQAATIILTDSGGIQEEAVSLGKPVLVMRDTTERPEGLLSGLIKLVGTNEQLIVTEVSNLLNSGNHIINNAAASNNNVRNPYGDGNTSKRILDYLLTVL